MFGDVATQTYIVQDQVNVSLHKSGTNIEITQFVKSLQDRFSLQHIAVWLNMRKLFVCSDEWFNIHTTDQQMLTITMKASLGHKGVLFADTPVHLTHTALLAEDTLSPKDMSPIGKQPYRFLTFSMSNGISVGVLGDIETRIDLFYKALKGSNLPQLLGLTGPDATKPSVVEIQTPPYCVRWTFTLSLEETMREFTNSKDPESYRKLFDALQQQLPAYILGDFPEREQAFECQYVAIREQNACLFRIKSYEKLNFDHRQELRALFLGQKSDSFSLGSTEVAAKAFFSYLCKQFVTDM